MDISGNWFLETVCPDLATMLQVRQVLYAGSTAYQKVEVLESDLFGRSLILDGKTQSTEKDEHIYHEGLVHPAMLRHPDPHSVFIGGGGEGATLREVLAHKSVTNVSMVDLDGEVVELCRKFLPQHHQGSFDDPRVKLLHEDARGYLQNCEETFDVMVMDLVDPLEAGTAYLLYTEEFYQIVKSKLNPGGIIVRPVNIARCPSECSLYGWVNERTSAQRSLRWASIGPATLLDIVKSNLDFKRYVDFI